MSDKIPASQAKKPVQAQAPAKGCDKDAAQQEQGKQGNVQQAQSHQGQPGKWDTGEQYGTKGQHQKK